MLAGRSRARPPGQITSPHHPSHPRNLPPTPTTSSAPRPRAPLARPEPDYEVVEFPSEQYVNAKLNPPPPPPRPIAGHPMDAAASCGLCGGGGARVRCTECGRRALCISCDDMYHRHPKRRHHQRQALSPTQMQPTSVERPPLPPKATPPVPPPRRHKISGDRSSASPRPPSADPRFATLHSLTASPPLNSVPGAPGASLHRALSQHSPRPQTSTNSPFNQHHQQQMRIEQPPAQMGSMPYLPTAATHQQMPHMQPQTNTMGYRSAWNLPRASLPGSNMHPTAAWAPETWEAPETCAPQPWGRPLRRGASVLELGAPCPGCAHCASPWRYGSCHSLDHGPWGAWQQPCCPSPHHPGMMGPHVHPSQTPHSYRRADSRAASRVESRTTSRAGSRTGSRAASPAASVRSRASRRTKYRTPSPDLPSSDADSESNGESGPPDSNTKHQDNPDADSLGPPPQPPSTSWQCEHCTFVNEPRVRVCAVCCRTPTAAPVCVPDAESVCVPAVAETKKERVEAKQNGSRPKSRASTACGPSPPRDVESRRSTQTANTNQTEQAPRHRRDASIGPSPPRQSTAVGPSPPRDTPTRHSISVGPSPPRDQPTHGTSVGQTPSRGNGTSIDGDSGNFPKKSAGTSPGRSGGGESGERASRRGVSTTGTSPPPQNISTQTYEVPASYIERAASAAGSRSRSRRKLRDEARERSHSRHSLSSDTKESERSAQTQGGRSGRWEWRDDRRDRDSSPEHDWSEGEKRSGSRLRRRASHLDLNRKNLRSSFYGSEAGFPTPLSGHRAASLEQLAAAERDTRRGLQLARLLTDAERAGFSAAELHAALAQNPLAPLAWLRERWPSLCAGVRAAATRLAPGVVVSDSEARAALARHRGAMWPAVTDVVDRHKKQSDLGSVSSEHRLRGHVWGSPVGGDDDAAPPRRRADDSSDELDGLTTPPKTHDHWMYLPLDSPGGFTRRVQEDWINSLPLAPEMTMTNDELLRVIGDSVLPQDLENYNLNKAVEIPLVKFKPLVEERQVTARDLKSQEQLAYNTEIPVEVKTPPVVENSELPQASKRSPEPFDDKLLPQAEPVDDKLLPQAAEKLNIINTEDVAQKLKSLLIQAGMPAIDENLLLKGLMGADRSLLFPANTINHNQKPTQLLETPEANVLDLGQSENEFIDAYNALTRLSPLPNVGTSSSSAPETGNPLNVQQEHNSNVVVEKTDNTDANKNEPSQSTNLIPRNKNITKQNLVTAAAKIVTKPNNMPSKQQHIRHSKNIKVNKPITPKLINTNEDKCNNLSDLVDNTQRIIQQMKDEINSDINSLDDRDGTASESENSSSGGTFEFSSEHESSYSESEGNTELSDDQESDEEDNETADEGNAVEKITPTKVTRTSSEENEQFEEALDHIEEHMEDFKKSNFEVLDSIARSLQEESTLSIEHSAPKSKINRKQDLNNNFTSVNSFDQIYEELSVPAISGNLNRSPTSLPATSSGNDGVVNSLQEPNNQKEINIPKITNYVTKQDILYVNYKPDSPVHLQVIDNNVVVLNGEEDIIYLDEPTDKEVIQSNSRQGSHESSTSSHIESGESHNSQDAAQNSETEYSDLQTISPEKDVLSLQNDVQDTIAETIVVANIEERHSDVIPTHTSVNVSENEKAVRETNNREKSPETNIKATKSSIPKPIRVTQNNKQKQDKGTTKVIASKVPVRRNSLKQHAAPAPLKSAFGNVQSGFVKQLQSRLFSKPKVHLNLSKLGLPKTDKPSTSTSNLGKKKPAPQPPSKPQTPPSASPPKVKPKKFFRETCRTEDEWTGSESDNSQDKVQRAREESPERPPASPPPPVTLRRVSGVLIDLARVRLPEGSPERQARMLLAEGATETWSQARLAVELVSRGAEPPSALLAALECSDLTSALAYLYQECELCASRLPEHEMVSMLRCIHRCCRECAQHYFTVQITERSIADCVCPYCKEPELEGLSEDSWMEYFAHLDILLKKLLQNDVHELFQRKLRDRTLARDPNFRWCMECSSGFFVHPKQRRLRCPECRSVSCAGCRKPWSVNHEGITCAQYTTWLEDNDPERSQAAVQQHLKENGLECPRCHFKYSLSRGGCMHFTCTQCKFEFCYGCGKPFMMGARCGLSEYCAKLGLHAHHPRNCLFYLRDKEPHELQTLLQMNNVPYDTEPGEPASRCPVPLQRETPTGLVDGLCAADVPAKHAGLCKVHYLEYLAGLAKGLDPIPVMALSELIAELRRRALPLPERGPWDTDPIYAGMCAEIVKEKIPLD